MDNCKRKWIHWSTVCGFAILLVGLLWVTGGMLMSLGDTGMHPLPGRLGSLPRSVLVLSALVAARILGRLYLSCQAHRTESLTRGEAQPAEALLERAAVASAHPWALGLAGTFTGAFALAGVGLAAGGIGSGWALAAILGTVSALFWRGCFTDARFAFTADQAGVATHSLLLSPSRRIPWEEIGECRISETQNGLGRTESTSCILLDHTGDELLCLDLSGVDAAERERFLDAVRGRLGVSARAELIAAEVPDGTGTEPEAAQVPAGRGTEPEAGREPAPGEELASCTRVQERGTAGDG